MKKKPAYVNYSELEVRRMERDGFNLQFGDDFLLEDGRYLFNKSEIIKLYNKTLNDVLDVIENGTEKERNFAINLIGGLIVRPMRLH